MIGQKVWVVAEMNNVPGFGGVDVHVFDVVESAMEHKEKIKAQWRERLSLCGWKETDNYYFWETWHDGYNVLVNVEEKEVE